MTPEPRLAFVIPWFGAEIAGGAEMLCRQWTIELQRAGWDVRILTTTIREFASDWNQSFHAAGPTAIGGIPVHRFALTPGDHDTFNRINRKLLDGLPVSRTEEEIFYREGPNSDDLLRFIGGHREDYWYIFIPYPFGTSYFGVRAASHRALMLPCLHDEAYARMECMRRRMEEVQGLLFNSQPERRLAERLYRIRFVPRIVLGMGMDPETAGDGDRFRAKYGIDRPFLLYVGRRDATKGTPVLIDFFGRYRARHPKSGLELVLAGPGAIGPRPPGVHDLGFLSASDKYDAMAAADLFCHPSVNESFSIVLMESWLCGAPVLVNHGCKVTRDFTFQGGGGVTFDDYADFEAAVEYLEERPRLRLELARSGAAFVRRSFAWPALVGRFGEWMSGLAAGRCGRA